MIYRNGPASLSLHFIIVAVLSNTPGNLKAPVFYCNKNLLLKLGKNIFSHGIKNGHIVSGAKSDSTLTIQPRPPTLFSLYFSLKISRNAAKLSVLTVLTTVRSCGCETKTFEWSDTEPTIKVRASLVSELLVAGSRRLFCTVCILKRDQSDL